MNQKTYIMRDSRSEYYKIGKSKNPKVRERTLSYEIPTIETMILFDVDIENELHFIFAEKRKRGEWFGLDQSDIDFISILSRKQENEINIALTNEISRIRKYNSYPEINIHKPFNERILSMINAGELKPLNEVLEDIFENHMKPSKIGISAYNKFRSYKKEYKEGRLGKKGLENLLEFFGFEAKETLVGKIKVNDLETKDPPPSD